MANTNRYKINKIDVIKSAHNAYGRLSDREKQLLEGYLNEYHGDAKLLSDVFYVMILYSELVINGIVDAKVFKSLALSNSFKVLSADYNASMEELKKEILFFKTLLELPYIHQKKKKITRNTIKFLWNHEIHETLREDGRTLEEELNVLLPKKAKECSDIITCPPFNQILRNPGIYIKQIEGRIEGNRRAKFGTNDVVEKETN